MAIQNIANGSLGNYPVHVTKIESNAEVQSVCAILPFISNQDDNGAGTVYTGYALRGSSGATASWFIMKSTVSGNVTSIRFASNPFVMDQIWDNRAALTYT